MGAHIVAFASESRQALVLTLLTQVFPMGGAMCGSGLSTEYYGLKYSIT